MGIENRDYFRQSNDYSGQWGSWGSGLSTWPPVVKFIIFANVVVFVAQIFLTRAPTINDLRDWPTEDEYIQQHLEYEELLPARSPAESEPRASESDSPQGVASSASTSKADRDSRIETWRANYRKETREYLGYAERPSVVYDWLQLETSKVVRGQVWRIITCAFCHGGIWHILFNMLFLFWFGVTLERMYGSREFCWFYFTAAIISSLAYMVLDAYTGDLIPAIGASGAVMGVLMLYAIHYPRDTIRIYFLFPIEIRWIVLFYVVFDLYPVLQALAGNQPHTGTAHAAHLGGLAFGYIYWRFGLRLDPWLSRLRVPKFRPRVGARSKIRLHRPSADHDRGLDQQVDEILRKINEQGRASLTESEEALLDQASQRYRNRPQ